MKQTVRVMMMAACCVLFSCSDDEATKGAVLVKVCRDGTHIYRLRDGSNVSGLLLTPVEDLKTVCP